MTTPIDITKYKTKFEAYPADLLKFCADAELKLPGIDGLKGQATALMAHPDVRGAKHLTRIATDAFFKQIGMEAGDSIQSFNKPPCGLQLTKGRGKYCLAYPFVIDRTDLDKRKGCAISGDREAAIEGIKGWWRKNLVEVPSAEWQLGHLDPTVGDASESNLAWQPPLQARYRNRFKWDPLFHRMWPTGEELVAKMGDFYTDKEQRLLLAALKAKFPDA